MQSFYPNNIAELLWYGKILFFSHLYLTLGVVQCVVTSHFNIDGNIDQCTIFMIKSKSWLLLKTYHLPHTAGNSVRSSWRRANASSIASRGWRRSGQPEGWRGRYTRLPRTSTMSPLLVLKVKKDNDYYKKKNPCELSTQGKMFGLHMYTCAKNYKLTLLRDEVNWLFYVTVDVISVINVTVNRCSGVRPTFGIHKMSLYQKTEKN